MTSAAADIPQNSPGAAIAAEHVLGAILLGLFFFSFHTKLESPEIPLPFLGCGVFAFLLLIFYVRTIPSHLIYMCAAIFLIGMASEFTAPHIVLLGRLRSLLYLGYSLICASAVLLAILKLPRQFVASLSLWFALALLLGALLELLLPPIRDMSDNFNLSIHPGWDYGNWARDISMTGGIRPKFFSPEPAKLALSIGYFTTLWYRFSADRRKHVGALALIALTFLIVRSPSAIAWFSALAALMLNEWYLEERKRRSAVEMFVRLLGALLMTLAVLALAIWLNWTRIQLFLANRDPSALIRFFVPPFVTAQVMLHYPAFGLGLGAFDEAASMLANAFSFYKLDIQKLVDVGHFQETIASVFFEMLIMYGVIWSIATIFFIRRLQRRYIKELSFAFWSSLFVASLLIGAMNGIYIWVVIFTFFSYGQPGSSNAATRLREAKAPRMVGT